MNKSLILLAVIVLALGAAGSASADHASITLYPGENWISAPLPPFNPDPAAFFAGLSINGNLTAYDPVTGTTLMYDSAHPELFGGIMWGQGYKITNNSGSIKTVGYEGFPEGLADPGGPMCDALVDLPGWIGTPYNHPVAIDKCYIAGGPNGGGTLAEAISEGWIDGLWTSFDNVTKQTFTAGPSWMSPDDCYLRPGQMYQVVTHVGYIGLIIPASAVVPEPSSILALGCGIGCLGLLRRRRSR